MNFRLFFCFFFSSILVQAQTLGGNAAYNFVRLPSSPLLTAAGGVNVSYKTNEVGFSVNNPALLHPALSKQVATSFINFAGGIKAYSLGSAYLLKKADAIIAGNIFFLDYGQTPQTDASGNVSGSFRPVDFMLQASASKKYLSNWSYGLSARFIRSSYQQYRSSAVAVDVGVLYEDSSHQFTVSILAKNMGFQLSSYAGEQEDLPFDLQVGISKKLQHAPFGFSITAQHLHRFDITYNDPVFNDENDVAASGGALRNIFNHFVFASHIFLGDHLEATVGLNVLKRTELSVGTEQNGLAGFSGGIRAKFQKLQVLYSRSQYQRNMGLNHFGITMHLDELGGFGK